MKALSIRQPWTELILAKRKTIEIRSWNTKFRGYFLIHSSKNLEKSALTFYNFDSKKLQCGFILGYAKLDSVIQYNSKEEFLRDKSKHLSISEPRKYPVYGFVLKDIHRIKPITYKGRLGFFEVEYKMSKQL